MDQGGCWEVGPGARLGSGGPVNSSPEAPPYTRRRDNWPRLAGALHPELGSSREMGGGVPLWSICPAPRGEPAGVGFSVVA